MKKNMKKITLILTTFILLSLTACSSGDSSKKINIVHKNYTEQRLLGTMMGQYVETLGYDANVTELGGSMLVFEAIKSGDADLYAEYTGTAYGAYLNQSETLPSDETFKFVKDSFESEYGITWLEPFGFNNTYVLSIPQTVADEYGIVTISDLEEVSDQLVLGSDSEFPNRDDGLPGLQIVYPNLEFKNVKTMDQGLLYPALENGEIEVVVAYATEGKLKKYGLINLVDDKAFFPPYDCAPIINMEFAESHQDVVDALNKLANTFSDSDMQEYNLLVDEGESVEDVAALMLSDRGITQ